MRTGRSGTAWGNALAFGVLITVIGAVVFFIGSLGAVDPLFRTRVTATIDQCPKPLVRMLPCSATWAVDGMEHSGYVEDVHSGSEGQQFAAFVIDESHIKRDDGFPVGVIVALAYAGLMIVLVLVRLLLLRRRSSVGPRPGATAYVWGLLATVGALAVAAGLAFALVGALDDVGPAAAWGVRVAIFGLLPSMAAVPLRRALRAAGPLWAAGPLPPGGRSAATFHDEISGYLSGTSAPPAAPVSPATAGPGWSHTTVRLADVVVEAMWLAARERPDERQPLTTGRVLAALARTDMRADWQRIWLYTGDPATVGLADAPDPPGGPAAADWRGVPLSHRLARALALLDRLSSAYLWNSAGSGATMLALVADRNNGATQALLRTNGVSHAGLLRMVQADIIKTTLSGLSAYVPAAD